MKTITEMVGSGKTGLTIFSCHGLVETSRRNRFLFPVLFAIMRLYLENLLI